MIFLGYADLPFRIILLFLSVLLYVNHHILHRPPQRTRSGRLQMLEALLLLSASSWTLAIFVYVAGVTWPFSIPLWTRWMGVVFMGACLPLSEWIYRTLGDHFSKKIELRPNHELIRSGPYRLVRHPMYTTLFVCAIGTCLISASMIVWGTTAAVAIVFLVRIRKEEAILAGRFGNAYQEYRRDTGALLPRLVTLWR